MNNPQIFKLIFKHDLRLNELSEGQKSSSQKESEASILDFMKPDPTYSKLHFSGTDLENETFGLNTLTHFDSIIKGIEEGLKAHSYSTNFKPQSTLVEAIKATEIGHIIIIAPTEATSEHYSSLKGEADINLKDLLESDLIILHKVAAPNGFDLILYSMENVYFNLFPHLHKLVPDSFRFFSINGKKFNTERHFYFETWTLARPPHGFEEVFPETSI